MVSEAHLQPDVLTSALLQAHCSSASTLRQPYFSSTATLQRPRLASLSSSSLTLHRPYSVLTSARLEASFKPSLAAFQPRFSRTAPLRQPYFRSTPICYFRPSSCPTSAAIQLYFIQQKSDAFPWSSAPLASSVATSGPNSAQVLVRNPSSRCTGWSHVCERQPVCCKQSRRRRRRLLLPAAERGCQPQRVMSKYLLLQRGCQPQLMQYVLLLMRMTNLSTPVKGRGMTKRCQ